VDQVLEDRHDDWGALARNVRLRKFGANVPDDFREKARQMRFLQYRGFEQDQIRAAISRDAND
jgi:regulatory protein